MDKKIVFLFITTLLVIFISLVSAQETGGGNQTINETNYTAEYDPEILEEFNKSSEAMILVKLYSRNMSKVNEILSTLPETEFRLKKKLQAGNGFSGYITLNGFNTLINNFNIKSIYLNKPLHVVNEDEEEKKDINSGAIKNDSTRQNLSTIEKEKDSEIISDISEVEEIKPERKNVLGIWITFFVIILIVIIYLFIKFRRK